MKTKTKTPMLKAYFKVPKNRMRSKRVWIANRGGHYDTVAIFSSKPKLCDRGEFTGRCPRGFYTLQDNKELLLGTMDQPQFEEWFGLKLGRPKQSEFVEVRQCRLTGPFNEDGMLETIDFEAE